MSNPKAYAARYNNGKGEFHMRHRKLFAWTLSFSIAAGLFAGIPVNTVGAETPVQQIEILLPDIYNSIYVKAYGDNPVIEFSGESGTGIYFTDTGTTVGGEWDYLEYFDQWGNAAFSQNGKYGAVNRGSKQVISAEWDKIELCRNSAVVYKNGKCGLVSMESGNIVFEPQADKIDVFEDGSALAEKDGKYSIVLQTGEIVGNFSYADALPFSEGLAAVENADGKWGYINLEGKTVLDYQYDGATSFSGSSAYVEKDGKMYAIGTDGQRTGNLPDLAPEYDPDGRLTAPVFGGDVTKAACIRLYGEEKYRYAGSGGRILTDAVYLIDAAFESDGTAVQRTEDGNVVLKLTNSGSTAAVETVLESDGVIRKTDFGSFSLFESKMRFYNSDGTDIFGRDIYSIVYNYISSSLVVGKTETGYISVTPDGKLLLEDPNDMLSKIDEDTWLVSSSRVTVPYILEADGTKKDLGAENADAYYSDGCIYVIGSDGKYGAFRTDGTRICDTVYDELYDAGEGMLLCHRNGEYGFIDKTDGSSFGGFDYTTRFFDGAAWVKQGSFAGTVNKNGEWVIEPLYWPYDDTGNVTVPMLKGGFTAVRTDKDGLYCFIDKNGNRLCNPEFSSVSCIHDDYAAFSRGSGKYGLLRVSESSLTAQPESIEVSSGTLDVYIGLRSAVNASVAPDNARNKNVVFTSENTEIAEVDTAGRVLGKSAGTTRIKVSSAENSSVYTYVTVNVLERTVHSADETVPMSAWENELWLAEQVIIQLRAKDPDAVPGGSSQITYGDLAEITEITLPYIADDGNEHHIPAVIGDFTNLIRFSVGYEKVGDSYYEPTNVFSPLLPELPEEAEYLTNLTVRLDCIYSSGYDENIIRAAGGGIPDPEFYAAVRNSVSYLLQDSSGGLVKDMNVSDLYVSRCGISSIEGISLLDFTGVYYIDLSCNMITDISELAKTNISGATVDLSFNQLNLSDQATAAAIEELERRGCTVKTGNQNAVSVTVYQDVIEQYTESTVGYIDFIPDGMDKDSLSVSVSDSAAARAFLRQNEITVIGFLPGDVTISVLYDGKAIWQGSITIEDPTAPLAPQLTLNISEWDPTYADVYCNSQISYGSTVYYRPATDTAWRELFGGARLYENGTYEFVLENEYGYRSEVVQLEVSGIKRSLKAEDFADPTLYEALKRDYWTLYEGMPVSYLDVSALGITELKGLELLDFRDQNPTLYLAYNSISDISVLAELDLIGGYIDLTGNCLNLEDPETAAVIAALRAEGCTVETGNQFPQGQRVWFASDSLDFYADETEVTYYLSLYVFPEEIRDQLEIRIDNSSIAEYEVDFNRISVTPSGVAGKTYIRVFLGEEEMAVLKLNARYKYNVEKPEITYTVNEYDPTYAELLYDLFDDETLYFRKQGEDSWAPVSYDTRITENGIYEFMVENRYGSRSEIVTLTVTGLAGKLQRGDFTDQRIYDALVFYYNSNIYEGMKIDYLSLRLWGVERLEDLLKLDFTGSESTIDLSCNNISDISVLGKLGLENRYINLEANRLDLNDPDTLSVIEQLEEAGCTVYLENQNTDTEYFEFFNGDVYAEAGDTENPVIYYGYYPSSDADGLSFAAENGGIFEIVSVSDGRVELRMTGTLGKDRLLVYHGDRLLGSVSVVYYDYDIPTAVTVNVYKNMAGIAFDLGTEAYPSWLGGFYVRKSGEQEWTLTEMYFAEAVPAAGENVTYEFMYITNENINSPVTEFTLCNNGEFIYLTGGGEITLIACSDENGTGTLKVPREIGGYTVTEMARDALLYTGYSEIILPDTLEKLGSNAIPWSAQLLLLPDSLTDIDEYALPNIGDTFVICCSRDSAAHRFITENNIGCILWLTGETGDINGDGEVDIRDFVRLKKLASAAESAGTDGGDLNSDGFTDAYDIALLRKYFLSTVYSIIKS